jgi:cellulose biosynthesis protein BcsQ
MILLTKKQSMGQTIVVAFCNQKGGVGKSTIAVALASYLHYVMGKNIAIVDCDTGQLSLANFREREKQTVTKVDGYKELMMSQWERTGKKAYPIVDSSPTAAMKDVKELLSTDAGYDLVIVDLPGSVSTEGVLSTILNVDYVIVPVVADRFDMQSTLGFATAVMDYKAARKGEVPLKEFLFFWNKVDRRVSTDLFDAYSQIMKKLRLTVLAAIIPLLSRYGREMSLSGKPFFRSTLLPPDEKMLQGSNIDLLAAEICERINV